jgi:hypothetical protein
MSYKNISKISGFLCNASFFLLKIFFKKHKCSFVVLQKTERLFDATHLNACSHITDDRTVGVCDEAAANHGEPMVHGPDHHLDIEDLFHELFLLIRHLRVAQAAFVGDDCCHADGPELGDGSFLDRDAERVANLFHGRGFQIRVHKRTTVVGQDIVACGVDHIPDREHLQTLVCDELLRLRISKFCDHGTMRIQHEQRANDRGVCDAKFYDLGSKHRADVMPGFLEQAFL